MQFDDDWDESTWTIRPEENYPSSSIDNRRRSLDESSEYSVDEILDQDNSNLFSDPESEWTATFKIEEPEEDQAENQTDSRPESDQPEQNRFVKKYGVPSFVFDSWFLINNMITLLAMIIFKFCQRKCSSIHEKI